MVKGYAKLKGFLVEHGIKQDNLARDLGINRVTLSKKLNQNNADFSLEEVRYICSTYELDANQFFLL